MPRCVAELWLLGNFMLAIRMERRAAIAYRTFDLGGVCPGARTTFMTANILLLVFSHRTVADWVISAPPTS